MRSHAEPVMGTVVSIAVADDRLGTAAVDEAVAAACEVLHRAEAVFSTYRADSPMSRMRRGEVTLEEAPPEVAEVLAACAAARELTGGWFDADAMPGGTDPTGLVKGWAAQRAADALVVHGVTDALVNAAGDAVAIGRPCPDRPWRMAVRDPFDPAGLVCVVPLRAGALATSGTYERGAHVLDPATAQAATSGVVSASVLGPDLAVADALATALVAGGEHVVPFLAGVGGYSALLVRADHRLVTVGEFPGEPWPAGGEWPVAGAAQRRADRVDPELSPGRPPRAGRPRRPG